MRVNPLPFVLAPGVGAIGYLVGDGMGIAIALGGWMAIVCSATALIVYRHARRAALERKA